MLAQAFHADTAAGPSEIHRYIVIRIEVKGATRYPRGGARFGVRRMALRVDGTDMGLVGCLGRVFAEGISMQALLPGL